MDFEIPRMKDGTWSIPDWCWDRQCHWRGNRILECPSMGGIHLQNNPKEVFCNATIRTRSYYFEFCDGNFSVLARALEVRFKNETHLRIVTTEEWVSDSRLKLAITKAVPEFWVSPRGGMAAVRKMANWFDDQFRPFYLKHRDWVTNRHD